MPRHHLDEQSTAIRWKSALALAPSTLQLNRRAALVKTKLRTMERAAFFSALATKKFKRLCFCAIARYGNASTRMSAIVPINRPMAGTPTSQVRLSARASVYPDAVLFADDPPGSKAAPRRT